MVGVEGEVKGVVGVEWGLSGVLVGVPSLPAAARAY